MHRHVSLLLIPIAFLCVQCAQESGYIEPDPYEGQVDARLVPYFQSFVNEAALRGVQIDIASFGLIGHIRSIQDDDIAGTCTYHSHTPNVVTIDLEYWNSVSSLRREMVVFHELGHCVLGRGHLESAYDNGLCTTIMNSGTSGCYIAYTTANRGYYLDELFANE